MSDSGPPDLPGFDFEAKLGSGGFSDVYRYHQHRPERQVAVKVLREAILTPEKQRQFENEINRMSSLSQHPGILTIYEANITPDGRAYFTMEYCPGDHFGEIARAHPLSEVHALEVGVKVAGAVETAHQAGILHRDIKPANILQTAYGEPALTDFGIASGRDAESDPTDSVGVTIPFAAPEVLSGRTPGDERSDVYSLGATIYALITGRAPFSTGRPMPQSEAISAILQGNPRPIDRPDVSAEFETAIRTALARQPEARFSSAASFGRALQTVEVMHNYSQTRLQVGPQAGAPTRRRPERADVGGSATVVRPPSRVDPTKTGQSTLRSTGPIDRVPDQLPSSTGATAERFEASLPVPQDLAAATVKPARSNEGPAAPLAPEGPPPRPGPPVALLASVAAVVVLLLVVGAMILFTSDGTDEGPTTTTTADPGAFVMGTPPATPVDVAVSVDAGQALVTWAASDAQEGDGYRVTVTSRATGGQQPVTTDLEQRITLAPDESTLCVQVIAIRTSQVSTSSTEVCAP